MKVEAHANEFKDITKSEKGKWSIMTTVAQIELDL